MILLGPPCLVWEMAGVIIWCAVWLLCHICFPCVYGEGDSNLSCQAGFKLPSPSPLSIHLLRGAKQLPNAQRTVKTHAKLQLFNLYWSLFMSSVLKILLIWHCFATFLKGKTILSFLYSCCTAGGFFLICTLCAYGECTPFRPPNYQYLAVWTDELQIPMEGEGECESARVELLPLCTHLHVQIRFFCSQHP